MSDRPEFQIVDAFEDYVRERITIDDSGCWLWKLSVDRDGYAQGKGGRMHRKTYEHSMGPIPPGLELDHTCEVRHCINPKHLEPVTTLENKVRHYVRAGRTREEAERLAAWDLDMYARSRALNAEQPPADP